MKRQRRKKFPKEVQELILEYYYWGFNPTEIYTILKEHHKVKISRATVYNYVNSHL